MAHISDYKKKIVKDITKLAKQYSIVGVVNMEGLPAPQLQSMKSELRGKINLFMTKKRLMKIALEDIKSEKNHIEELEKYFEGMPAFIFTNENPFKLSKLLQKSKTSAPARAGQTAPEDITVNKGPTPFAPGPVISELSSVGLKVGVENGKVAVKEDTVIAKKGEKIKPKVAEILTRLDIKPMEVGLGLVAAYEDGLIYQKDILVIDEKGFNDKINLAATQAFNLAFNITYTTKDNINLLIAKAFNDAKAIGISQKILDKGIIEELLSEAERSMLDLKSTANIQAVEKPKEEPKPEEKKIEAPTQKEVEKKLSSESEKGLEKPEVFQKEEKVLEEEKEIIEEEKKLEEEKPKEVPVEREVQEEVKKEEEKNLEKERIEKEKELENVEEQKEERKPEQEKPKEDEIDKKVKAMVEKTKKFAEGTEETASDIIEDVKKEEAQEEKEEPKPEPKKEQKEQKVPTAFDLKKQQEKKETPENKEDKERKEVEDLTKELLKKGTLRKK
jgi:large subunit ribosomal protein L10